MTLNGSLDDYSPAGALKVLSSTGETGAVRFSGVAGCTVYLHQGQLYFARDEHTDQALAVALVRPGRLTADDWARAIDVAGDSPRVGELLVDADVIDADLLASVALSVVYDPLIRLFREGDGAFDFEPDTVHWIGPFRTFNVDAIVSEVRRRVREVDEMSTVVPGLDAWVTATRTLPDGAAQVTLLREDWELVTALSGSRTVTDLAAEMGRGCYSTARVVHRLAEAGLVDVTPGLLGAPADAVAPGGEAALSYAYAEPAVIDDPALGLPVEAWAGTTHDPVVAGDAPAVEASVEGPWDGEVSWDGGDHLAGSSLAETTDGDASDVVPEDDPIDDAPDGNSDAPDEESGADGGGAGRREPSYAPPVENLRGLEGMLEENAWGPADGAEQQPVGVGARATNDDASDGDSEAAWALPRRQPAVALREDPAGRTNPWPAAEDLAMNDPANRDRVSGLENIAGFHNAVGPVEVAAPADPKPELHPNAAWLENLYAQYMDEPEVQTKKRKKEVLDVAFAAPEQDAQAKVGTLRRLMDALKKI